VYHPLPLLPDGLAGFATRDRAIELDAFQHFVEEARTTLLEIPVATPLVVTAHLPAQQVVQFGRHVAGLVNPILEQLARGRRLRDQGARMWAQTREQWQFLAAHQHVDRVDLDEADPVEHAPRVAAVDPARRARRVRGRSGIPADARREA